MKYHTEYSTAEHFGVLCELTELKQRALCGYRFPDTGLTLFSTVQTR